MAFRNDFKKHGLIEVVGWFFEMFDLSFQPVAFMFFIELSFQLDTLRQLLFLFLLINCYFLFFLEQKLETVLQLEFASEYFIIFLFEVDLSDTLLHFVVFILGLGVPQRFADRRAYQFFQSGVLGVQIPIKNKIMFLRILFRNFSIFLFLDLLGGRKRFRLLPFDESDVAVSEFFNV